MSNSKQPMALVTGGAGGMGLATVERLARDGFSVVMVDRDEALARRETQRLQGLGLAVQCRVLDLTDEAAVRALVQ